MSVHLLTRIRWDALNEHAERVVGQPHHPRHRAEHADVVDLLGTRDLHLGIAPRDERDRTVAAEHVVDERHRSILADVQWHDEVGECDRVAQGQHAGTPRHRTPPAHPVDGDLRPALGTTVAWDDLDHPLSI